MSDHSAPIPQGSALEHGSVHERHHRQWSRRHFLRGLGLGGGGALLLGKVPVLASATSALERALGSAENDRILVLLRLKGGNDGLNTVIPLFDYGTYQALRPDIRIPQLNTLPLNGELAIPKTMQSAYGLWQDGKMKVVQNVGYPEQNLSHFTSTDIWASADPDNPDPNSGWMGRYLDGLYPQFAESPPAFPPALQIGGAGSLFFQNEAELNLATVVNNPEQLARIAQDGQLYDPADVPECYYGEQLSFLRSVANTTYQYAEVINQAYEKGTNSVEYSNALGLQLATVARLIKGGLPTALYMVTLDGFDTHAGQENIHPYLLQTLSDAVRHFFDDLAADGQDQRVLAATLSEFGRRIEQNGSKGTDHGAAAPLMLFGPGLEGEGVVGENPDLQDLDAVGNLKYSIDFRRVFATLLEYWLCVDPVTVDAILGDAYNRMPELGFSCSVTSVGRPPTHYLSLEHQAYYRQGELIIEYTLPKALPVRIRLFTINGKQMAVLADAYQMGGAHRATWTVPAGWPLGVFVYTLEAGPYRASGKAMVSK